MKREILFRGKRVDNGEWVEGYYYSECGLYYIFENRQAESMLNRNHPYAVIHETIGQFTGLTDKNGVKIFEQDIVRVKWWNGYHKEYQFSNYEVYYDENQLGYYLRGNEFGWEYFYGVEVIGNIHDDLSLLNSDKEDYNEA